MKLALAFAVAVFNNFWWNRHWTFDARHGHAGFQAAKFLTISVLALGTLSLYFLRREDFPRFELDIILVTVPYPGASPEEVENGVCQKIEEAVRSIDGLKKVTSVAAEGAGNVIIEVKTDVPSVQKILNEVESEVKVWVVPTAAHG